MSSTEMVERPGRMDLSTRGHTLEVSDRDKVALNGQMEVATLVISTTACFTDAVSIYGRQDYSTQGCSLTIVCRAKEN